MRKGGRWLRLEQGFAVGLLCLNLILGVGCAALSLFRGADPSLANWGIIHFTAFYLIWKNPPDHL